MSAPANAPSKLVSTMPRTAASAASSAKTASSSSSVRAQRALRTSGRKTRTTAMSPSRSTRHVAQTGRQLLRGDARRDREARVRRGVRRRRARARDAAPSVSASSSRPACEAERHAREPVEIRRLAGVVVRRRRRRAPSSTARMRSTTCFARAGIDARIARLLRGRARACCPCVVRIAGGANHGVPCGASLHQLLAVHDEQVAAREVHHVERAAAADRVVDDLVDLRGRRDALLDDARRLADVVAEDVVRGEALDVGRDDRAPCRAASIVSTMRAPRAASPDSTTSIGSVRHAGKNGWFTKQRSGCFASVAICARGMPDVAKPMRQSGRTTASRLFRIDLLDREVLGRGLEDVVAVREIPQLRAWARAPPRPPRRPSGSACRARRPCSRSP